MKAYEIKVTIKNSKPPIWRKIIIPANINFMQMHNIIQVAFEWLNYHLYEFTFKEFSERITNDRESCEESDDFYPEPCKTLYAAEVSVDKYLKKVKKFTYIYDFGDWWEHTVEIVNCIEDYEYDYPRVTKFRQASPPDDCGGIYGYYDFLEQYLDDSDPDHDSMVEWAESQGYHDDYDINEINKIMEGILDFDMNDSDVF